MEKGGNCQAEEEKEALDLRRRRQIERIVLVIDGDAESFKLLSCKKKEN